MLADDLHKYQLDADALDVCRDFLDSAARYDVNPVVEYLNLMMSAHRHEAITTPILEGETPVARLQFPRCWFEFRYPITGDFYLAALATESERRLDMHLFMASRQRIMSAGTVQWHVDDDRFLNTGAPSDVSLPESATRLIDTGQSDDTYAALYDRTFLAGFSVLFAILQMHHISSDVRIVEPSEAVNRKRRRRAIPPQVVHRVVHVPGFSIYVEKARRLGVPLNELALMLVPGHYRRRPGRAAQVQWDSDKRNKENWLWIKPYVKGDEKNGVVLSQYVVDHPQRVSAHG